MTTSGRVVPTALAASPASPLPLEAAAPLLVDQQGRLLVNVASTVAPPLTTFTKVITDLDLVGLTTPVVGAGTLQRVTVAFYAGTGFLMIFDGGTGGTLLYTPIPIPTTLPAYIDVEFDTINGLAFAANVTVAISTSAPTYTAPTFLVSPGTVTTSYRV